MIVGNKYEVIGSSIDKDTFVRLLGVLIGINLMGFIPKLVFMVIGSVPLFVYPATGWYFTTAMIFTKYANQLMVPKPTEGEGAQLLPS